MRVLFPPSLCFIRPDPAPTSRVRCRDVAHWCETSLPFLITVASASAAAAAVAATCRSVIYLFLFIWLKCITSPCNHYHYSCSACTMRTLHWRAQFNCCSRVRLSTEVVLLIFTMTKHMLLQMERWDCDEVQRGFKWHGCIVSSCLYFPNASRNLVRKSLLWRSSFLSHTFSHSNSCFLSPSLSFSCSLFVSPSLSVYLSLHFSL